MFELSSGMWQSHLGSWKNLRTAGKGASADVLVMYVFSNTDPQYLENLRFFLREGVYAADGCEYLFIVNRSSDEKVLHDSPIHPLPRPTTGNISPWYYDICDSTGHSEHFVTIVFPYGVRRCMFVCLAVQFPTRSSGTDACRP
jgi:hypothetical protein